MTEELRGDELRAPSAPGLRVRIAPDAAAAVRSVASEIAARVRSGFVLGVATGNTPLGVYAELARLVREEGLSFAGVTVFALDEYVGLATDHPASFHAFVERHVVLPLGLDPAQVHVPRGDGAPERSAAEFEERLARAGGVDLQLLGIGRNGHLAFNEPGSERDSRTRVVELARDTREANVADFPPGEAVPTHAVTQGIANLLEARQLRVLAFGAHKATIVARTLRDPIGSALPATFLREHGDAELVLDAEAAREVMP